MSRWHVTAIERLGAPSVAWPSVYGPATGSDPVTDNGLSTADLTPYLSPLENFSQQMERDLTGGSFSSIKIDLADADGSLADALGPFSATMAGTDRYFGPWIQVIEKWGTTDQALRFLGYIDETSIQWSEDDARTQFTVLHASQLLQERLITDFPELLRPWPSVPTTATEAFSQSTADALLDAAVPAYTPRANATTLEAALWAAGQMSWMAGISQRVTTTWIDVGGHLRPFVETENFSAPSAPSPSFTIGATTYYVDHIEWDPTLSATTTLYSDPDLDVQVTYKVARIYIQGAPDLTGILTLGTTVTWGISENRRTHYLLIGGSISAPTAGSDGQKFVPLNTVEELAPGDVLTLTFTDATSGDQRTVTADLPPITDLDGETGKAFLATGLSQGYTNVSKVRRNSQDPVLFDGVAYAQALVAPFTIDLTNFTSAPTDVPVLTFQPYNVASPSLYGAHNLQTVAQSGTLRLARRGADNGSSAYPTAGAWSGTWSGTWSWLGLPSAETTHQIFGDVLQWPGGTNAYTAPVIYIEGDLSGGATIPPNGWRSAWRTWKALDQISQDPESTWDGSAVAWTSHASSGDVPSKLVHFAASTPTPGRYIRTSAPVWTFEAHTADATLGSSGTPTISGTYPTGNTLALGMGIYAPASSDEQEALLALIATGSSHPFTNLTACLLSQASGGNLTVRQTASLWNTGDTAAGPWALGGGLVVQTYAETIDGLNYPRTVLHKLNGTTVITANLKTLEVIPQTIQPLLLTGTTGAKVIGGWYALALETYADANFAPSRRLRFLHLNSALVVVNGRPEVDPSDPLSTTAYFSRGEMVASVVPDGALIARMVRTSNTADKMAGLIGGRLFTVGNEIPRTVERLKIGATVPQGNTLSVANSGDGMGVVDYLNKFAAAQLATAVPGADGNLSLVSRSGGTLRVRTVGAQHVSVQATERGKKTKTQAWQGYIRTVRVTYADLLADATASVEVSGSFDGGRIMEMDLSELVSSPTMSVAIGRAAIYWYGQPSPILTELWADRSGGVAGDANPTWWATWQTGDRVVLDLYTPSATVTAWKLLKMQPGLEARTVQVELRQQPFTITGT